MWSSYSGASGIVTQEAVTLVPLYRQTTDLASDKRDEMCRTLRDFATSISHDGWPAMAKGGSASPKAQEPIGSVCGVFGSLTPASRMREIVDAEFLRTFSDKQVLRNKRLTAGSLSLSSTMWIALITGAIVTVTMSFFLYLDIG